MKRFNNLKLLPDVQKEEWQACSTNEGFAENVVGYRQDDEHMKDFVEKQVSVAFIYFIKYYKTRFHILYNFQTFSLSIHTEIIILFARICIYIILT